MNIFKNSTRFDVMWRFQHSSGTVSTSIRTSFAQNHAPVAPTAVLRSVHSVPYLKYYAGHKKFTTVVCRICYNRLENHQEHWRGVITWVWKRPLHPAKSIANRTTARRRCASTAVTMAPATIARAIGCTAHAGARRLRMHSRKNMKRMSAAGRTPPQMLLMKAFCRNKAQAGDPRSRADRRLASFRSMRRSGAEDEVLALRLSRGS